MNSTNNLKKEKEILLSIALDIINCKQNSSSVDETNRAVDSYYKCSSLDSILKTYSFETIIALRNELIALWHDKEEMKRFIPVVLASAFKLRPSLDEDPKPAIEHKDGAGDGILPVYTYTL